MGMERHSSWYNRMDNGVSMSMKTKQKKYGWSLMISEQDLLNIGLSKYYVEDIVKRISEYKKKWGSKALQRESKINGN